METKEFEIIDAINIEGIDNSCWGLCHDVVAAATYWPVFGGMLKPHIYVYGDDKKVYGRKLGKLLKDGYDKKLYYSKSQYVAFFWLKI